MNPRSRGSRIGLVVTARWPLIGRGAPYLFILLLLFSSGWPRGAEAGSGIEHGAIRWDAWYTNGPKDPAASTAYTLSPQKWHSRAPIHAHFDPSGNIQWAPSQATFDAEIRAAEKGGLAFWAYLSYGTGRVDLHNSMMRGLAFHRASSIRQHMRYTLIVPTSQLGAAGNFADAAAVIDSLTRDDNWMHVRVGKVKRPLLFLYYREIDLKNRWGNSAGELRKAIQFLRNLISYHDAQPYIVVLAAPPLSANETAVAIGADAIGTYACCGTRGDQEPWNIFEAEMERYWRNQISAASNEIGVVPNWMTGWANIPRKERPPSWATAKNVSRFDQLSFTVPPTNDQLVTMFKHLNIFVQSNIRKVTCNCTLGYSWSECDEGGNCLMPTYGDPTGAKLAAIAATIRP